MSADIATSPSSPATAPDASEAPAAAVVADVTTGAPETPLAKLTSRLPEITKQADYSEMWGVDLSADGHAPTQVVLLKFLRANNNDVAAAEKQLTSALEWRKKMQPAKLASETFDSKKFGDLGFVTVHKEDPGKETVITWNIYGAVKDNKATFGNVEDVSEFVIPTLLSERMETWTMTMLTLKTDLYDGGLLSWNSAFKSFASMRSRRLSLKMQTTSTRCSRSTTISPSASSGWTQTSRQPAKKTIQTFSMAYPELLAHKYFVNVPTIMGWMYGVMKLFLAPATLRKFHPMTSGTTLATELKGIQSSLPQEYGGNGPSVKEGETVKLDDASQRGEEKGQGEKAVPTAPVAATSSTAATGQGTKELEEPATADAELNSAAEVEPAKKEVTA